MAPLTLRLVDASSPQPSLTSKAVSTWKETLKKPRRRELGYHRAFRLLEEERPLGARGGRGSEGGWSAGCILSFLVESGAG